MPAAQRVGDDEPDGQKLPGAQVLGAFAPNLQNEPMGHGEQAPLRESDEKVPFGHGAQAGLRSGAYVPGPQPTQGM